MGDFDGAAAGEFAEDSVAGDEVVAGDFFVGEAFDGIEEFFDAADPGSWSDDVEKIAP
jgi:hypothetical protein